MTEKKGSLYLKTTNTTYAVNKEEHEATAKSNTPTIKAKITDFVSTTFQTLTSKYANGYHMKSTT